MKTSLGKVIGNLAIVMALAGAMTLLLLWRVHCATLSNVTVQRSSFEQTQPPAAPVLPAWVANQVFTQSYTSTETIVWPIPSCNVVITLPKGLIGDDRKAWLAVFTFTTKSKLTFPAPLISSDSFFKLDGDYVLGALAPGSAEVEPQDFSFSAGMAPLIEWSYRDADLGEIQESSLRLYREWGLVGDQYWKVQTGWVDTRNKKVYASPEQLDTFGFGGCQNQLYLPLILSAASGE